MKTYRVYESPIRGKKLIKDGWSWFAFLLPFIWALVNRLWGRFFLLLTLNVIAGVFINMTKWDPLALAFGISIGVVVPIQFALEGYKWKGRELLKRGFENIVSVNAESKEGAMVALLKREATPHYSLREDKYPLPEENEGAYAFYIFVVMLVIFWIFEAHPFHFSSISG